MKGAHTMSIAIVTDSTAYLDPSYIDAHQITILPLSTSFSDGTYIEGQDLTADQFYDKMAKLDEIPTTSQPSTGLIQEKLQQLAETYEEILVLTISSGISGTAQTVQTMASELSNTRVEVYDSEITCHPLAFLVEKAVTLAEQGEDMSTILAALNELKANLSAYFVVEDLNHLAKGGRLSQAGAMMGGLLKIKPLLYFKEGKIEVFEKVRTSKKAVTRITDLFEESYTNSQQNWQIAVIGPEDNEYVQSLLTYFKENHPDIPISLHYFGPVIGTHLGADAFGVTWTIQ